MRQQGVIAAIVLAVAVLTFCSLGLGAYMQSIGFDGSAYLQLGTTGMGGLLGLLARTASDGGDTPPSRETKRTLMS